MKESGGKATFAFEVLQKDSATAARLGLLHTSHGDVQTPVFMPVGTAGAVKALPHEWLEDLDAQIILANTYHLYLRPGHERLHNRVFDFDLVRYSTLTFRRAFVSIGTKPI